MSGIAKRHVNDEIFLFNFHRSIKALSWTIVALKLLAMEETRQPLSLSRVRRTRSVEPLMVSPDVTVKRDTSAKTANAKVGSNPFL